MLHFLTVAIVADRNRHCQGTNPAPRGYIFWREAAGGCSSMVGPKRTPFRYRNQQLRLQQSGLLPQLLAKQVDDRLVLKGEHLRFVADFQVLRLLGRPLRPHRLRVRRIGIEGLYERRHAQHHGP